MRANFTGADHVCMLFFCTSLRRLRSRTITHAAAVLLSQWACTSVDVWLTGVQILRWRCFDMCEGMVLALRLLRESVCDPQIQGSIYCSPVLAR